MRLSLCLAVYNEEKFIHYPLDSAYDLVDEVIIVDGGSEDKTVQIAKSYGKKVKVFIEDNPSMFHINKQKAIEKAKGEWILQLDADEELSEGLKKEIRKIVDSNSQLVAYFVPRKNFFLTRFFKKGGQYPDYTIRLYRNGYAKFPCQSVHENVVISNFNVKKEQSDGKKLKIKEKIGYLKSPLLHYADQNFSRYLDRWNRYSSLEAEMLLKEKKINPSIFQFINFFFLKPSLWFLRTYIRHKGFMDGFPGFIFALFSSLRFWVIYIKVWQKKQNLKYKNTSGS